MISEFKIGVCLFSALVISLSIFVAASLMSEARASDDTFSCLREFHGPLVQLNRDVGYRQIRYLGVAGRTRFDARGLVVRQQTHPYILGHKYPVDLRMGSRRATICWAGGAILNTNPPGISWQASKTPNNAALILKEGHAIVDGVRIHNAHDGIRPWHRPSDGSGLSGFSVRNSWLSYIRDDCIENDSGVGGVIDDNLFDGCYVFLSTRGGVAQSGGGHGMMTISNNLVRLQRMPGPFGHSLNGLMGHGELFKSGAHSPRMSLLNNVFLIEGLPVTRYGPDNWSSNARSMLSFRESHLDSCVGNVIVWLGGGPFPGSIPDDPGCVTVTDDISVWERARTDWLNRHPLVARLPNVDY